MTVLSLYNSALGVNIAAWMFTKIPGFALKIVKFSRS